MLLLLNDKDFIKSFNTKKPYYYFGNIVKDIEYNLFDNTALALSHPNKSEVIITPANKAIAIRGLETRGSIPLFAKNILKEISQLFNNSTKGRFTLHSFSGYGSDSKSFNIHRDPMCVFYLQVYGEIVWSIWESDETTDNITPEQGTCVFKQKFMPGDMIYIRPGTYHHVEHLDGPRIGFSFGNS